MKSLPLIFSILGVLTCITFPSPELTVCIFLSSSLVFISGSWDLVWWGFKLDQLSVLLCFLSFVVLYLISVLCTKNKNSKMLVIASILCLIIGLFFLTDSLIWFFIMFELSLVPLMFMLSLWGKQAERITAIQFILLYTIIGSSPLLVSVLLFIKGSGSSLISIINFSHMS